MARAKKSGFIPKHHTLKGAIDWLFRGAPPFNSEEDCEDVYGADCEPKEVTTEVIIREKKG